jgi:gluconolactonase
MKRPFRLAAGVALLISLTWAAAKEPPRHFELKVESSKFWELVPKDSKLELVASGMGFTEGPVWDPAGFVYVSDEVLNKIFRIYPDGRKEELISLGDPDGNTYNEHRQLIDCASVLRAVIRIKTDGIYTVLADRYQGRRFNSPNDVVIGPDGAIYFTDPTSDVPKNQKQELDFKGVFRLDAQGQVRLLTKELTEPNGLAFSPDGKRLYVDDSAQRNIRVYDFQPDGTLRNGRIFSEEPGGKGEGVPDGMKLDRAGNLYVTGPGGIWIWDSDGNHLGTIILPEQPANLAWGDSDLKTLYITATTSLYKLKTSAPGFVPYLAK